MSLRPEESAARKTAGGALAVVPPPGVEALALDLLEAENPIARAVGLDVLPQRAALDLDRIVPIHDISAPALVSAAIRALVRVEMGPRPIDRVVHFLGHPDPDVAWEAARALTLWGASDALRALREGRPLAAKLGARALEALVTHAEVSPDMLDAIGRFGNPLAWSFLLHFLADRELGEAAERALLTLFGSLVPEGVTRDPAAWRDALMDRDFDPAARYRRGEPWTSEALVREHDQSGNTCSQRDVERRIDEFAARTGRIRMLSLNLDAWQVEAGGMLRAGFEE